jgi:hypothetical protein
VQLQSVRDGGASSGVRGDCGARHVRCGERSSMLRCALVFRQRRRERNGELCGRGGLGGGSSAEAAAAQVSVRRGESGREEWG